VMGIRFLGSVSDCFFLDFQANLVSAFDGVDDLCRLRGQSVHGRQKVFVLGPGSKASCVVSEQVIFCQDLLEVFADCVTIEVLWFEGIDSLDASQVGDDVLAHGASFQIFLFCTS
jgi:hypothetical protein